MDWILNKKCGNRSKNLFPHDAVDFGKLQFVGQVAKNACHCEPVRTELWCDCHRQSFITIRCAEHHWRGNPPQVSGNLKGIATSAPLGPPRNDTYLWSDKLQFEILWQRAILFTKLHTLLKTIPFFYSQIHGNM